MPNAAEFVMLWLAARRYGGWLIEFDPAMDRHQICIKQRCTRSRFLCFESADEAIDYMKQNPNL